MKRWLYDRRTIFLFLTLALMIQAFIFYIYDLEWDAFWYLFTLEFVLTNLYLALDFYRHALSHKYLSAQMKAPDLSWMEYDGSQKDLDYQRIIRQREAMRRQEEDRYRQQDENTRDLYDMWVHQNKLPIAALKLLLDEEHPDIREMKSQVLRLEQYTQMILAVSRMNSPQTDYVFRYTDLDPVLRHAIRTFSPEFISRHIRLDYQGTKARVLTDARWLTFVVEQILSNALKHARHEIRILVEEDVLLIRDDGPGIPSSDLKRVFEKVVTGLNGRQETRSTGLGLYLSRQVLEQLGHRITIETEKDRFTEVRIDLSSEILSDL